MDLIAILLLLGVMYAMLILPQQRRLKRHQQLVESIDVGDEILTTAGIYGTVVALDPDDPEVMSVEIAEGVVVDMSRVAVSEVAVDTDETVESDTDDLDDAGAD